VNFSSDNAVGASPRVMQALADANAGALPSYGQDPWTARAEAALARIFDCEPAVFLVATGTAANALALAAVCPPFGAVLAHAESHINTDECGAPEAFTAGAKLIGLPGQGCKLTADALEAALRRLPPGVPHSVQARAVSISQATEAGTVYRPEEIRALAAVAKARGLAVHMDGARLANALVATGAEPAELTWRAGVDVLSLGLTKGGALAAEAVVFFDRAAADDMTYRRKRSGHLVSKGRLLGAQAAAMLEEGHWLELAADANARAARLARGLVAAGLRLAAPVEANELFPVMPRRLCRELKDAGAVFYEWPSPQLGTDARISPDEVLVRLVTSWATTDEEVDRLLTAAREGMRSSIRD